jgi:hypothetical protein
MTELQIEISKLHPEDDLKKHSDDYWKGFEACKKETLRLTNEISPSVCELCREEL